MNVLILGGTGYIGSKVALSLSDRNMVYRTKRGIATSVVEGSIVTIPADLGYISALFDNRSIDCIVNCACNYGRSEVLYSDVITSNVDFPLYIMDLAIQKGINRFVTIGTGLPDDLNMYAFSKKIFSDYGRFYAQKHGVDFYNLKLQMFYGADEPKGRFIPSLIIKMLAGEAVKLTKGTQHRDIIDVADVIKAIRGMVMTDIHGYHEIPVGTGIAPTISELADFIYENTGRKSIMLKGAIPMRTNEPDCVADTVPIDRFMEWHPVFWKDGILNMIDKLRKEVLI